MRYYHFEFQGQKYNAPSVTTVLDTTLPPARKARIQAASIPNPTRQYFRTKQARENGNLFDGWVKRCFQTGRYCEPPYQIATLAQKSRPWISKVVEGVGGQTFLDQFVHRTEGCRPYAGTLDAIAPYPGAGLCLYEFKTSLFKVFSEAVSEASLQAAAYAYAWSWQHPGLKPDCLCTFHATPYGVFENLVAGWEQIDQLYDDWLDRLSRFGACLSQSEN